MPDPSKEHQWESANDKEVSGKIGDERFYAQRFLSLPVPTESRVESDVESRVESDVESDVESVI